MDMSDAFGAMGRSLQPTAGYSSGSEPADIKASLEHKCQKLQHDLDNVKEALAVLEAHPEFVKFLDALTKIVNI